MFIWVNGESNSGSPKWGTDNISYASSSVSASYNTGFGWDMAVAVADSTFYCGSCGYTDSLSGSVTAD